MDFLLIALALSIPSVYIPILTTGATIGLTQATKKIIGIKGKWKWILPFYNIGVGIGLSFLADQTGIQVPLDPVTMGLLSGGLASAGYDSVDSAVKQAKIAVVKSQERKR